VRKQDSKRIIPVANNFEEAVTYFQKICGNVTLRMKCSNCSHWNRIDVEKLFSEQATSEEPKVKAFIPMYFPLKTEKCSKRGHVNAEEKELIRIQEIKLDTLLLFVFLTFEI
jgi:hypothetical protein